MSIEFLKSASSSSAAVVTREINGTEVKFWPVSIRFVTMAGDAVNAIANLITAYTGGSNDGDYESETDFSTETFKSSRSRRHQRAADPEVIRFRHATRSAAVAGVTQILTDKKSHLAMAELILDSCRDANGRGGIPEFNTLKPQELVDTVDGATLILMFVSACRASAGVFVPLAQAAGVTREALAAMGKEMVADLPGLGRLAGDPEPSLAEKSSPTSSTSSSSEATT